MERLITAFALLCSLGLVSLAHAEPIGLSRYVIFTPSSDDADLIDALQTADGFAGSFYVVRHYRTPSSTTHPAYVAVLTTPELVQVVNERYSILGISVTVDRTRKRASVPPWRTTGGGAFGGLQLWGQLRVQSLSAAAGIYSSSSPIMRERGTRVCVVDSGIHSTHPVLAGKVALGWNFAYTPSVSISDVATGRVQTCGNDSDTPRCSQDEYMDPHGTHVAGIIAARDVGTGASGGITGIDPRATLLSARAIGMHYAWNSSTNDFDTVDSGYTTDIAQAIYWCAGADLNPPVGTNDGFVDRIPVLGDAGKAQVINLSLGGFGDSPMERDAVQYALDHGLTLVAAAGNERDPQDLVNYPGDVVYPGAYPGVIAVAATTPTDRLADYSSRGPKVIAAPGDSILSSTGADGAGGGSYDYYSGSSMATAFVTGTMSRILSVMPYASAIDIRTSFVDTIGYPLLNTELSCRR